MDEPLVSVIIPVYNVVSFVKEAVDSVINQTYRNLEIIIIDDGSNDGSELICDEYMYDLRVKVVHQKNHGLSSARNSGLNIMTGDVVAFLDSDDYFYPEMIATMIKHMLSSDADIVICDYQWDNRKTGLTRKSFNTKEALKELIAGRVELANWNKIYKRYIWDDIRFPEGHIYEGTRTTFRLIEKANYIEQLSDCLMFHRTRSGSIVQTKSKENSLDFFMACQEYEKFVIDKTPSLFSEKERDKFFECRFNQKIPHWITIKNYDSLVAEKLKICILDNLYNTDLWRAKTKAKLFLFIYCPRFLVFIYNIKHQIRF